MHTYARRILLALIGGMLTVSGPVVAEAGAIAAPTSGVQGVDVSRHQGKIDWKRVRAAGIRFAYIKATEGTNWTDPTFDRNYPAAWKAGIVRGAYHFALPNRSSGAAQADFFVRNGGRWSADNRTLPGALDIEYNPYGPTCYGLNKTKMVAWIGSFLARYHARTGWAVIYTTTDWWKTCTGNTTRFASASPLWIARYNSQPGALPGGWKTHTFWQYTDRGRVAGISGGVDRDRFNGSVARLLALANNTR